MSRDTGPCERNCKNVYFNTRYTQTSRQQTSPALSNIQEETVGEGASGLDVSLLSVITGVAYLIQ